jgi:hypothetical protein
MRHHVHRTLRHMAVAGGACVLVLALFQSWSGSLIRLSHAAPGAILQTVDLPTAAQCPDVGEFARRTSVFLVPGSTVGHPEVPILVGTSCFGSSPTETPANRNLFFIDPDMAALVKTITTSVTPQDGWGACALRGDQGDLICCENTPECFEGCISNPPKVYAIDISAANTIADGTSTFLFNTTQFNGICNALAWDTASKTVYTQNGDTITRWRQVPGGTTWAEVTPAFSSTTTTCSPLNGLAASDSLFAACGPPSSESSATIKQLNKTSGAVVSSFNVSLPIDPVDGIVGEPEDLECDPLSFADTAESAIWTTDRSTNKLFAVASPACGLGGGAAPPPLILCAGGTTPDADGDGLLDCWETPNLACGNLPGIPVAGGGCVPLPGATPTHKDIYVEVDWMAQHEPFQAALDLVVAAFANAPVTNQDGTSGVRLHFQKDEQALAHNDNFVLIPYNPAPPFLNPQPPNFDTVKAASFGTAAERANTNKVNILNAKRLAFHYLLMVHNLNGLGGTSGVAEKPGNDLVVALGSWGVVNGHAVGTVAEQAATIMHELGHNLGLGHGGGEDTNCKPNYLSVMNYTFQFDGKFVSTRPLDYSRAVLPTLNEASLNETKGIGGSTGNKTSYGPKNSNGAVTINVDASGGINWDGDRNSTEPSVSRDLNNFGISGCQGSGSGLTGYNDWANLLYNFRGSPDYSEGVHLTTLEAREINIDDANQASGDPDDDEIRSFRDNCPYTRNRNQADSNNDGVGDACQRLGDVNGDGVIDNVDLALVNACVGQKASSCDPRADVNGDGIVDGQDVSIVANNKDK